MEQHIQYKNVSFTINVNSDIERHRFDTALTKEPETIKWIEDFFLPDDVFLDVGANIGIFTLCAAALHPNLIVYASEPAFHNFYKLCLNAVANKWQTRVLPLGFGLGEKSDYVQLHLSSLQDGSASHSLGRAIAQKDAEHNSFSHLVAIASLDELIEGNVIKPPNHIKIDVDGVETSVVRGMSRYLTKATLKSVLIELDHKLSDTSEIFNIMKDAGFRIDHPVNRMLGHSRERREASGHGHIENVIFTK